MGTPAHTDPSNTHQCIPRLTQAQQQTEPQPPPHPRIVSPIPDPVWSKKKNIRMDNESTVITNLKTKLTNKINVLYQQCQ